MHETRLEIIERKISNSKIIIEDFDIPLSIYW